VTATAFALATLLKKPSRGIGLFRTIFYLPTIVPLIASATLWLFIFNPQWGLLNQALGLVGIPPQQWIFDEALVVPSLVLMAMWSSAGVAMIVYLAGLQGIPQHLYEAVEIDGGGAWARFRHVTLPMMTPLILFNVILGFINAVQTFVQPYVMTQGGPNNASLFYMLHVYQEAFTYQNMGYACALAWVLFVGVALVSFVVFRTSRW